MLKTASHLSWVSMAVAILGILMTANSLPAQPVIESAIYYTDFWYENPLGWPTGHHFVACASVRGDGLVTVEAQDQKGTRVAVPHDHGNWYCKFVEGILVEGMLTLTATDQQGDTAIKHSTNLDEPREIGKCHNIRFSSETDTPAVFWDPNMDAEGYYVRIYQTSTREEIFRSPPLKSTIYQLPDSVLKIGTSYVFRILAHDYDACNQHVSGFCVENRSSTFSPEFIPQAAK